MPRKKFTPANKCKVCNKILREYNKNELCEHHYKLVWGKKYREKRKENHICIQCGKKVEPRILYPAGKTISPITKYPVRCYICRTKQDEFHKKKYHKTKPDKQNKKLLRTTIPVVVT